MIRLWAVVLLWIAMLLECEIDLRYCGFSNPVQKTHVVILQKNAFFI